MGTVTDLFDRLVGRQQVNSEQGAHERVLAKLRGRVDGERLAIAQARAARNVRAGVDLDEAVRRAVAWALDANPDPTPPKTPTAIAA